MDSWHPVWSSREIQAARDLGDLGAIVRLARRTHGLTQAQLGRNCGYSAATISRLETGKQPLNDLEKLRLLSRTLAIPPRMLGLAEERHATTAVVAGSRPPVPMVGPDPQDQDDGDDPVRRRELLAGAAGLAGVAAFGLSAPGTPSSTASDLADHLYGTSTETDRLPAPAVITAVARARAHFQAARYDELARGLPSLIAAATASRNQAHGDAALRESAALAEAYIVASAFMVKQNQDVLACATADRAMQAATASDDPLTVGDARRAVATVMRRLGNAATAQNLLSRAARDIEPGPHPTAEQLSMYGTLLQVAAYTAAVDGKRATASEYIAEAKATAARLGRDANYRFTAFGPTNVTLYQISIAQILGDNGTAIEHAKTLRAAAIPTPERQGRYWIDVARAFHQWGKTEACYRALLAAEQAAPAEVRYRPPVYQMVDDLMRTTRRGALTGLPGFAARVGVPE